MGKKFEKYRKIFVWIYLFLTIIKLFTANIYTMREEDPTIYFKPVPTFENTFYGAHEDSIERKYYEGKYDWYKNGQYWEVFHSPGGMQDIVCILYNTMIVTWWVLSVIMIFNTCRRSLKK